MLDNTFLSCGGKIYHQKCYITLKLKLVGNAARDLHPQTTPTSQMTFLEACQLQRCFVFTQGRNK
jgi:hypothetical protein